MCNTDITAVIKYYTSPDSTVTKTTSYGLVGAGFASWYQFNPNQVFKDPLGRYKTTSPSSTSINKTNLLS